MNYDETPQRSSNELILNPGEQAFLQDKTTGGVQTHVGPIVVTQTGQLRPIQFKDGVFKETNLQGAVSQCVSAQKGQYLVLQNPTVEENGLKHPTIKNTNASVPELRHGEKVVVPGPCEFAIWPQQSAECIDGHHLRTDQYLVVRVYDEKEARENWSRAIVTADDEEALATQKATDLNLTLGQLFVIRDVSFYIPPTGVEVVKDENGKYIRDALTLEMSEYAILVDQNGNKRYEKGPQIVFPSPTEEFFSENGNIKFKPIELTPTQGLHIKINCDYTDTSWPTTAGVTEKRFHEGDEIFITGAQYPIYYPCEEHSIIRYGDNLVHYATAVSAGQARYVMNKDTGVITTRRGPDMILLNPTEEVFVTRVLSDAESLLMYPGNEESLKYNRSLRSLKVESDESVTSANIALGATARALCASSISALPDQIIRKTSYTKPHSVTLDDRFAGAPTLKIWTGFAVLLTKADGSRRVEVGPKVVVLDFDETVAPLHLSTGKPKTTDTLLTTGYLEVKNNKVSDIIEVETLDGVRVSLKVSYRVSFNGEPEKWFDVDNYVKFLCDHARSRLKGTARRHNIRSFYVDTVDIVRNTILGDKVEESPRPGLQFEENGMQVTDVELLAVEISDADIERLLSQQQQEVITNQIHIDRANQKLEVAKAEQQVELAKLELSEEIRVSKHAQSFAIAEDQAALDHLCNSEALERADEAIMLADKDEQEANIHHKHHLSRRDSECALEIEIQNAETANIVSRFQAANGDLATAIRELGDKDLLTKVATAMGPMRIIGGASIPDALISILGSDNPVVKRLTDLVKNANES
jgi:major vault protein